VIVRRPGDSEDRDLSWLDASFAEDLSLDGRLLLFTEFGQGGGPNSAAYLRGTDGSPAVRLGPGRALALSPDAKWAICAAPNLPSDYLELQPTGSGESRRLTANRLRYTGARWLPDNQRLIVSALEAAQGVTLYVLDLEGGQPTPLTPPGVSSWTVSPEGSTIAVSGLGSGIQLHGVEGGTPRNIPGTTDQDSPVGWVHDGLLILRSPSTGSPLGEIYRIDPGTGRQHPWRNILPTDRAGIMALQSFRVTPDGRSQAYSWHRALSNLYVVDGLE
jgi:hypothetical protein